MIGVGRMTRLRSRGAASPAFYAERLRLWFADEPDRLSAIMADPHSRALWAWNVFASLETHEDQPWLAWRLQELGPQLRDPVRLSLFTGRTRTPLLDPSRDYERWLLRRTARYGHDDDVRRAFLAPVEVPVRIETPDVLVVVDTATWRLRAGAAGRDRLAELVDVGLQAARRICCGLAVVVVYDDHDDASADLARRLDDCRDAAAVARLVPWWHAPAEALVRGVGWRTVVRVWDEERPWLDLSGQPVREFRAVLQRTGML